MAQLPEDEVAPVPDDTAQASASASAAATGAPSADSNQDASRPSVDITQPGAGTGASGAASTDANDESDEKMKDLPPKTDVTLTLKGTPEFNAFPFTVWYYSVWLFFFIFCF